MPDIFDNFEENPEEWAFEGAKNKNQDSPAAFDSLDAAISGEVDRKMKERTSKRDNPPGGDRTDGADKMILGKFRTQSDLESAYRELERTVTEKSQKLKKLETAEPLIEAISRDENLLSMIDNYFNDPASKSTKRQMGLPDDFQMDINEALENPESDSAKVFGQIVQSQAAKIVEQREQAREARDRLTKQAAELKAKYKLDDDQVADLVKKGQSMPLTLEDVYLILNKDQMLGAARVRGAETVIESQQRARRITPSGARQGGAVERGQALMDVLLDFQNNNKIPI